MSAQPGCLENHHHNKPLATRDIKNRKYLCPAQQNNSLCNQGTYVNSRDPTSATWLGFSPRIVRECENTGSYLGYKVIYTVFTDGCLKEINHLPPWRKATL